MKNQTQLSSNESYYITSPIYYVNAQPHIGHAYTSIACDIATLWWRKTGKNVFFATGTDEFGQKIEKTALASSVSPIELCNQYSQVFQDLAKTLRLQNNDFIRTTQERHKVQVQKFWQKIFKNNWIYKGKYEGWYAVRDEAFYDEKELIDGKAPTGAEVEWKIEECYFFKLSYFSDILLKICKEKSGFIMPQSRLNEIVKFLEGGLNDLCVSRTSFKWGVSVPNDENHVIYVWLDALTNYISILGYEEADLYKTFWQNCDNKIHIIGKDIIRFHAVYWPAFLIASQYDEESLKNADFNHILKIIPDKIFAHGWWTKDGQKMSKSLGNVINPFEVIEKYGLDKFRYFLFASNTFGEDGNFSESEFIAKTNADLANNFGNLTQRTLTIINNNFNGLVPSPSQDALNHELYTTNLQQKISPFMDNFAYEKAISEIVKYSSLANEFIDKSAPWKLLKQDQDGVNKAKDVMFLLSHSILQIANCLEVFCPNACQKVFDIFGAKIINHDVKLNPLSILFERV